MSKKWKNNLYDPSCAGIYLVQSIREDAKESLLMPKYMIFKWKWRGYMADLMRRNGSIHHKWIGPIHKPLESITTIRETENFYKLKKEMKLHDKNKNSWMG